jgi:hypothetical protein
MKPNSIRYAAALAVVAALPLTASALGKNEKGCLVGGAVGGVGGHLLGDHALLGAAAGCGVGAVVADHNKRKDGNHDKRTEEQRAHDEKVAAHERRVEERRDAEVRRDEQRRY